MFLLLLVFYIHQFSDVVIYRNPKRLNALSLSSFASFGLLSGIGLAFAVPEEGAMVGTSAFCF